MGGLVGFGGAEVAEDHAADPFGWVDGFGLGEPDVTGVEILMEGFLSERGGGGGFQQRERERAKRMKFESILRLCSLT